MSTQPGEGQGFAPCATARPAARPEMPAQPLLELGREALDPAVERDVIDLDAAVGQHECQVAVADREPKVPAHRPEDHLGRKRKPWKARAVVMSGALGWGSGGSAAPTRSKPAAQRNRARPARASGRRGGEGQYRTAASSVPDTAPAGCGDDRRSCA